MYLYVILLLFVSGPYGTFKEILMKEGIVGLYKGNAAQMIRIFPYAAIQFSAFEQFKKVQ